MAGHFTQEQGCKCEVAFLFTTKIHITCTVVSQISVQCTPGRVMDFLTMLSSSTFLAKMSLVGSSSIHVLSRRQHRGYNILMMIMIMTMMVVAMIGSNICKSTKANNQDAGTDAVVELLKVTGKWRRSKRILRTARSNSLRPWDIKHTKEKMFSYENAGSGQTVLIQKKMWSVLRTGIQFLCRWTNFEQKYKYSGCNNSTFLVEERARQNKKNSFHSFIMKVDFRLDLLPYNCWAVCDCLRPLEIIQSCLTKSTLKTPSTGKIKNMGEIRANWNYIK